MGLYDIFLKKKSKIHFTFWHFLVKYAFPNNWPLLNKVEYKIKNLTPATFKKTFFACKNICFHSTNIVIHAGPSALTYLTNIVIHAGPSALTYLTDTLISL